MAEYRNIESMLLSNGVLSKLCGSLGRPECFTTTQNGPRQRSRSARCPAQRSTISSRPPKRCIRQQSTQLGPATRWRNQASLHARRARTSGDGRDAGIPKSEKRHLRPISFVGCLKSYRVSRRPHFLGAGRTGRRPDTWGQETESPRRRAVESPGHQRWTLSAGQLIDIVKWNLLRHIPVKMRGGRR